MKQISWHFEIIICIIMGMTLLSCKKGPVKIKFINLKNYDYVSSDNMKAANKAVAIDKKPFEEYFNVCEKGITNKPGILISCNLKNGIGTYWVQMQVIDATTSGVIYTDETDITPDRRDILWDYNLPNKGKFIINIIVLYDIIARGEIEYK